MPTLRTRRPPGPCGRRRPACAPVGQSAECVLVCALCNSATSSARRTPSGFGPRWPGRAALRWSAAPHRPPRSVLYVCASYRTALRAGCDRRQCRAFRAGYFGARSCAARAALLRRFVAVLAASGLLALQRWRFVRRGGSPPSPRRADAALPPFPRRAPASRPCGNFSGGQGVRSRAPLPLVAAVARGARALLRRARSALHSGASACAPPACRVRLRAPGCAARAPAGWWRLRRAFCASRWPTKGQAAA